MVRQLFGWNAARLGLLVVLAVGLVQVSAAGTAVQTTAAGNARQASASAALARLASLPLQAQSVISATLGTEQAKHAAKRSAGGYRLQGGGVTALFARDGLKVDAGGASLSMRLASVGRGSETSPLGRVGPAGHANRVTYAHPGVKEWYAAGPLGIEQGFTVSRRPAGASGRLTLTLGLGGSLHARQTGSQLRFVGASGRTALRFGGLVAIDANRHRLPASLVLDGRSLRLQVDDAGARYPLQIDPLIQQGPKLTGGGEIGNGQFGISVALSADGNTALIGGNVDTSSTGAAWVFTRTGGVWAQQGPKLTGTGALSNSSFGWSAALSADGNTALIGGLGDNGSVGAAWVFTRTAGIWTQQGSKLTGSGETGPGTFGVSVALAGDGNTALIGGKTDNGSVGAAWVFTRTAGVWTQQGSKLTGGGETGLGSFGASVALSTDGSTALIGGDTDSSNAGAAWVFTRTAGVWTQQGSKLTGSGGAGIVRFGFSVALSGDGNTALMGGPFDSATGAGWVFTRTGGVWTQQGSKLTGSDQLAGARFGWSAAISADGTTALFGGILDNSVGAGWVFVRSGTTWTQLGSKLTGSGEIGPGQFGFGSALSANGNTALIGGPGDALGVGAAWVFVASCGSAAVTISGAGVIVGTAGNDVILGSAGADTILGLGGNDTICGGLGNDYVDGGADNDTVYGDEGTGATNAAAPGGNDTIQGGSGNDALLGEGGVDFIQAGAGTDSIDAGAGNDTANGGDDGDVLYGGLGADTLEGAAGNDSVNGDLQPTQNVGGGPGVDPAPGVVDICGGGAGTDTQSGCEVAGNFP